MGLADLPRTCVRQYNDLITVEPLIKHSQNKAHPLQCSLFITSAYNLPIIIGQSGWSLSVLHKGSTVQLN